MTLLTLSSDISYKDYLVGAIKGQLYQINPDFVVTDLSHELSPFNYPQAAYICRHAARNFPPQTFHLILMNLFEQKTDYLLMAFHEEQYYLCADNGLLTMILDGPPEMLIGLPMDKLANKNALYCATVMGNAVKDLTKGKRLQDIGQSEIEYLQKNPLRPTAGDNWIEGQIIFIDNFENVVVNITRQQFEENRKGRRFRIVFKKDEEIDRLSESYWDAPEHEKLAFFNGAGYLEVAIHKGNAAGLFGLQDFTDTSQNAYLQNRLFYQTVRVYFE